MRPCSLFCATAVALVVGMGGASAAMRHAVPLAQAYPIVLIQDQEPPGASPQTIPSTQSPQNAAEDRIPTTVNSLGLTDDQKRLIVESVGSGEGVRETTGSSSASSAPGPGMLLPEAYAMQEFTADVVGQVPALRGYKFTRVPGRILIVAPANRIVVTEIQAGP